MMRITLVLLQSMALLGWPLAGVKAQEIPTAGTRNTLLWEVTGKGLRQPSYIMGTMHILCPEDAWLSPAVKTILEEVNAVYFEIDLDNMFEIMGSLGAMTMRNDTTLRDLLTPAEMKKLEEAFAGKMPFPLAMLERFKPMMLASLLSEQMLPCKAGSGTEMLLMDAAQKRKIPTNGLETASYQMGLFDSIPYAVQAKELVKALDSDGEKGEGDDIVKQMLTAFQQQDLDALYGLTMAKEAGIAGYEDLLINNRNRNWVAKFPGIAAKGSVLIAVGAGHLPGNMGVLKLLEAAGYTLRPLENKKPETGL